MRNFQINFHIIQCYFTVNIRKKGFLCVYNEVVLNHLWNLAVRYLDLYYILPFPFTCNWARRFFLPLQSFVSLHQTIHN